MIINWIYGRTLIRSRLIRPLSGSTFRTRTSTRSPGPSARLRRRWLTGSLSRLILLLWMRPERPTPISTKAPNKVVLSTRPVSTAPTRRSLIDTMPRLKSACPKSEDGKKREKKKKMRWLGVNKGDQVQVPMSTHVWGKRQRKGMPESKWQGRNDTQILHFQQQPNTCVCILPLSSALYFPPLFSVDRFPFCSINTNKEGLHPRK